MKRWIFVSLILLSAGTVWALRIPGPGQFRLPWTEDQIIELNNILIQMREVLEGRYEGDIVSTTKTNSKEGESWFIQTGSTVRIQYKAADQIFTVTPDGF